MKKLFIFSVVFTLLLFSCSNHFSPLIVTPLEDPVLASPNLFVHELSNFSSFSGLDYYDDPIFIDGDADFHTQASEYGWDLNGTRDGSQSFPYLIQNNHFLSISDSHIIKIWNTSVYFNFSYNFISNSNQIGSLIELSNVSHAVISNNNLTSTIWTADIGLNISNSYDTDISFNTISNILPLSAIDIYSSSNISVHDNMIINCSVGVSLSKSSNSFILNNSVTGSTSCGIGMGESSNINVLDNSISDSHTGLASSESSCIISNNSAINCRFGISIFRSIENKFAGNDIRECKYGMMLLISSKNNVTSNLIENCFYEGIRLSDVSTENFILNNSLISNGDFGIRIKEFSDNNLFKWNNLIGNNDNQSSQALDDGSENVFINNFWDDWNSSDSNNDGFFDTPYPIDGAAKNSDPYPLKKATLLLESSIPIEVTSETSALISLKSSSSSIVTRNSTFSWLFLPLIMSMTLIILYRKISKEDRYS